jgi:hypothetical protein
MEQHDLKNGEKLFEHQHLLLATFGGQSSKLYLHVAHFFNANVN